MHAVSDAGEIGWMSACDDASRYRVTSGLKK